MARVAVEEEGCEGYLDVETDVSTSILGVLKEEQVSLTATLFYDDGFLRYSMSGPPEDVGALKTTVHRPLRMEGASCPLFEQVDAAADLTAGMRWADNLDEEVAYGENLAVKGGGSMRYAPGGPVWEVTFTRADEESLGIEDALGLMEDETGVDVQSYYREAITADWA